MPQSYGDKHRAAYLKWFGHVPGMTADEADAFMARARDGASLNELTSYESRIVSASRYRKHCELNPEWAQELKRIMDARPRKKRFTKCRRGHPLTSDNIVLMKRNNGGAPGRACKICLAVSRKATRHRGNLQEQTVRRIFFAVDCGAIKNELTRGTSEIGKVIDFYRLTAFMRAQPKVAAVLEKRFAENLAKRRLERTSRLIAAPAILRNDGADAFNAIQSATAHIWKGERGDVQSMMYLAVAEKRMTLQAACDRVCEFLKAHRRRPRVYGDCSVDAVMGNGGLTWLDTKTDDDRLWA